MDLLITNTVDAIQSPIPTEVRMKGITSLCSFTSSAKG